MKRAPAMLGVLLAMGGMAEPVPYRNPNAPAPRGNRSRATKKTRAKNKAARQARRKAR